MAFVCDVAKYFDKLFENNVLTWRDVLYPDIPCGIVINPVLLIDKACISLFREIPNKNELYPIFHPPFDAVQKYRFEPPNIGLFKDAWLLNDDVNEVFVIYDDKVELSELFVTNLFNAVVKLVLPL